MPKISEEEKKKLEEDIKRRKQEKLERQKEKEKRMYVYSSDYPSLYSAGNKDAYCVCTHCFVVCMLINTGIQTYLFSPGASWAPKTK